MLVVIHTPTCINHATVTNAIRFLVPKGLRYLWAICPKHWVEAIGAWHPLVRAVSEDEAVPGVTREGVQSLMLARGDGNSDSRWEGRDSSSWYLVQAVNLGFVLRDDVLDTLVVHDADMMVLPDFDPFGGGHFRYRRSVRPRFSVKVGGGMNGHVYDYGCKCAANVRMLYHSPSGELVEGNGAISDDAVGGRDRERLSSFVTHSFVAFKPFMAAMLAQFASGPSAGLGARLQSAASPSAAPWLTTMMRCVNPRAPHIGFGEISTYVSFVLHHYPSAVVVQRATTWERNPAGSAEWGVLRNTSGSFCCNTAPLLAARARKGLEFLGTELGHSSAGGVHCAEYTSWQQFFRSSPYPPADHPYWTYRRIRFSASASLGYEQQQHSNSVRREAMTHAIGAPSARVAAHAVGALRKKSVLMARRRGESDHRVRDPAPPSHEHALFSKRSDGINGRAGNMNCIVDAHRTRRLHPRRHGMAVVEIISVCGSNILPWICALNRQNRVRAAEALSTCPRLAARVLHVPASSFACAVKQSGFLPKLKLLRDLLVELSRYDFRQTVQCEDCVRGQCTSTTCTSHDAPQWLLWTDPDAFFVLNSDQLRCPAGSSAAASRPLLESALLDARADVIVSADQPSEPFLFCMGVMLLRVSSTALQLLEQMLLLGHATHSILYQDGSELRRLHWRDCVGKVPTDARLISASAPPSVPTQVAWVCKVVLTWVARTHKGHAFPDKAFDCCWPEQARMNELLLHVNKRLRERVRVLSQELLNGPGEDPQSVLRETAVLHLRGCSKSEGGIDQCMNDTHMAASFLGWDL